MRFIVAIVLALALALSVAAPAQAWTPKTKSIVKCVNHKGDTSKTICFYVRYEVDSRADLRPTYVRVTGDIKRLRYAKMNFDGINYNLGTLYRGKGVHLKTPWHRGEAVVKMRGTAVFGKSTHYIYKRVGKATPW